MPADASAATPTGPTSRPLPEVGSEAPAGDAAATTTTASASYTDPSTMRGFGDIPDDLRDPWGADPLEINLPAVVRNALENDVRLRIDEYTLKSDEQSVPVEEAIYDAVLDASIQYGRAKSEPPSPVPESDVRTGQGQMSLTQLLPTGMTLQTQYGMTGQRQYAPVAVLLNPTVTNGLGASLTQPLLQGFGPRIVNLGIRIAQADVEGSRAQFRASVTSRVRESLDLYWDLVEQCERYRILQSLYLSAVELTRQDEARAAAGLIPETEILQARAKAVGRLNSLLEAARDLASAEDSLKLAVRFARDAPAWEKRVRPRQPLDWEEVPLDLNASVERAVAARPEMIAARAAVREAELRVEGARDQIRPRLDLFANAAVQGMDETAHEAVGDIGTFDSNSVAIGATFSSPLRNRRARHSLLAAESDLEGARRSLELARDQATFSARDAVRAVENARRRIDMTRSQLELQKSNLDAQQQQYQLGLSTAFEILQFQENLASAALAAIQSIVDYRQGLLALGEAEATLLETYGIEIESVSVVPPGKSVHEAGEPGADLAHEPAAAPAEDYGEEKAAP